LLSGITCDILYLYLPYKIRTILYITRDYVKLLNFSDLFNKYISYKMKFDLDKKALIPIYLFKLSFELNYK